MAVSSMTGRLDKCNTQVFAYLLCLKMGKSPLLEGLLSISHTYMPECQQVLVMRVVISMHPDHIDGTDSITSITKVQGNYCGNCIDNAESWHLSSLTNNFAVHKRVHFVTENDGKPSP